MWLHNPAQSSTPIHGEQGLGSEMATMLSLWRDVEGPSVSATA